MLKFIKENWLIAVIAGAVSSIITIVVINHWYSKNVSDVITSWITAISSLSVAVFARMAYKYATIQYLKQKKIDHGIGSLKRIVGLMFLHNTKINTPLIEINLLLTEWDMVKRSGGVDGDGHIVSGLSQKTKDIELLVNNFTNDWAVTIGPELTLLKIIVKSNELKPLTEAVQDEIDKLSKLILNLKTSNELDLIDCEPICLNCKINNIHNYLITLMSSILDGKPLDNHTPDQP